MARQVRSDGRIQAALLEAFKRDNIPFARLASYVSRRNLRCCNLKALETILEAWTRKMEDEFPAGSTGGVLGAHKDRITYANGDGEAAVDAVDKLLCAFIEIRRKQSPVWRKEQEGLKQGGKSLDALQEKEAARLDELEKLLKPTDTTAASVRKPGTATPDEELSKWPTEKVASEIFKQIRRDFGGKDEVAAINWMMARWKITSSVADSMYNFLGTMIEGCRKRVASKVEELKRRIQECNVYRQSAGKVKKMDGTSFRIINVSKLWVIGPEGRRRLTPEECQTVEKVFREIAAKRHAQR